MRTEIKDWQREVKSKKVAAKAGTRIMEWVKTELVNMNIIIDHSMW